MAIPAMAQQFRLIVKNGDELPGAPGDPVEYVYSERSFIDGGGNVVFGAELESGREGYWTQIGGETRLVAFLGEPAPGIAPLALSASSSSRPNLFFNANGELSMYTPTLSDGDSDGNNNRAILYFGEDGLEIVVRSGVETITVVDSRAGPVEWTMGSFDAFGSNGKEAVIRAGLRKPDNVSIFDLSSNNPGSGGSVWHVDPLGAEAVTYNPKELPLSPGWEMDSSGLKVAMNDVGDYVFLANGSGPDLNGDLQPDRYSKGIYRSRGGKMEVVLRESRTVASSLKLDVDELVMNNHGRIAFHGVMPPNNDSAIWVENADGRSFRRVAKVGDIALQGGGVAFSEFHGFHLSDEGLLTVWAVTSDGRDGVWMESKQGITYALWKVVMEGDDAPDDNGTPAVFSKLWQAIPNNSGQLLFSASREEKGDGSYIGRSFWIGSFHPIFDEPVFERVFGESDRVEVAQDLMPSVSYHTDISFSLDPFQNNSHLIGSGTPFNDDGQVLVGFSGNQFSPVYTQVRALGVVTPGGFLVNSLGDAPDINPGDGIADTGGPMVEGRPECTLRAAIMEANAQGGVRRISFDVPADQAVDGHMVIRPMSPMPDLETPMLIDATTMERRSFDNVIVSEWAELDGTMAGAGVSGLKATVSGCSIKGLGVHHFDGHGIESLGDQLKLQQCYIRNNSGDGIRAVGLEIDGGFWGASRVTENVGDGIHLTGDLVMESVIVDFNSGWGVVIGGMNANFNQRPEITSHVFYNGMGGIRMEAAEGFMDVQNLKVEGNGMHAADRQGHGIHAPRIDIHGVNVEASKNHGIGIFCALADFDFGLLHLDENKGHGLVANGDVYTDAVHAEFNEGWAMVCQGDVLHMNENGANASSYIKHNHQGGIRFRGGDAVIQRVNLENNGTMASGPTQGHGLYAPNASVYLFASSAMDQSGHGFLCRSADVVGITDIFRNGLDGLHVFEDLEIDKIRSEQNEGWGIWCGGNSFMVNVMEFGDTSYVAQNKKGGIYFAGSEAYLSRVSIKENGITSGGGGHGGPGSKSRSLRCGLLDEPRTRFGRWFDL